MIKQDILENQAKIVFLSIGSNLGNKKRNIELAKFKLQSNNVKIIQSSNNYDTLSWPNKKNPKFVNVVIKIKTNLSPLKLMEKCLNIEKTLGRKRNKKNEPRTCDIDIIDYNNEIINHKDKNLSLIIPHKELSLRNFVLVPLYEIFPEWKHPKTKEIITSLIDKLPQEERKSILKVKKN